MPTPLLHQGATVLCAHAGQAAPITPNPRVIVSGQPTATLATPYGIVGCALTGTPNPPCATAQWVRGAARVLSGGIPVLLMDSQAVCTPTGTPLLPLVAQPRVIGT